MFGLLDSKIIPIIFVLLYCEFYAHERVLVFRTNNKTLSNFLMAPLNLSMFAVYSLLFQEGASTVT